MSTMTASAPIDLMDEADDIEIEDKVGTWVLASKAARITGVPAKQIPQLAAQGLLEMRIAIGAVPARYSRRSCLALRKQLIRPVTRTVADAVR
jgi:uncharacterized protein (UPF0261 family)